MKFLTTLFFIFFISCIILPKIEATQTTNKSYRISVTVPQMAGANIQTKSIHEDNNTAQGNNISFDEIVREHKKVQLRTIVVK